MQGLRTISTHLILLASVFCTQGVFATGLVAALDTAKKPRDPSNFGQEYKLYFAALPTLNKSTRLPEKQLLSIPVTVGAMESVSRVWGAWISTSACFVPEAATINVTSISTQVVTGYMIWHPNYREEAKRCRDRIMPKGGVCADNMPATFKPCTNGALVTLDMTDAVNADGTPANSAELTERVRAVVIR